MSDQFVELIKSFDIELLKSAYLWKQCVDLFFGILRGSFVFIGAAFFIIAMMWSLNKFMP